MPTTFSAWTSSTIPGQLDLSRGRSRLLSIPSHFIHIQLRVRDDAYWDTERQEYRCPDTTPPAPSSAAQDVSNPVHTALAPVHARRAVDVAHAAVRDRVRGRSPGAPNRLAISPSVDFASLSGRNAGFDYTGSSRSLSGGVEFGAGSWQAGLVAAFTRTDLRYRAEASLAGSGYRAGEHDTEIFSVHPFAAWHAPSGEKLWASLGAGLGDLRHRDDPGFPSRSASDIRLRAWALGASVPVADVLSGKPRCRGRLRVVRLRDRGRRPDLVRAAHNARPRLPRRAGLGRAGPRRAVAVGGLPAVDGGRAGGRPAGDKGLGVVCRNTPSAPRRDGERRGLVRSRRLRARVLASRRRHPLRARGVRPRPRAGSRDPPDPPRRRGFGRHRLARRGGYGLWGGALFRTVRPYAGLVRRSGGDAVRRSLGVGIGATPSPRLKLEVYDDPAGRSRGIALTWRRRF